MRCTCHSSRAQWPEHGNSLTCCERQKPSLSVDELIAVSPEKALHFPPGVVSTSIVHHFAYVSVNEQGGKEIYRTWYNAGLCMELRCLASKSSIFAYIQVLCQLLPFYLFLFYDWLEPQLSIQQKFISSQKVTVELFSMPFIISQTRPCPLDHP